MLIHQVIEHTFNRPEGRTRIKLVGENTEVVKVILSDLPKPLWDSVIWMMLNIDVAYKAMGKIPCSDEEGERIAHYLYDEKRYDLFFATRFGHFFEDGGDAIAQEFLKTREQRNDYQSDDDDTLINKHLIHGQMLTFMQWCDEKDQMVLENEGPTEDMMRLGYLALVTGYKRLALFVLTMMTPQAFQDSVAASSSTRVNKRLMQKKWVRDFYDKQTDKRLKKKLGKRIIQYGLQL